MDDDLVRHLVKMEGSLRVSYIVGFSIGDITEGNGIQSKRTGT